MKYLHIMHNEKFIASYIEFINNNFNLSDHYFLIIGGLSQEKMPIPKYSNIEYLSNLDIRYKFLKLFKVIIPVYSILFKKISKSKKIFLHGLFDKKIIFFLFIFRKFLKKSNWIIWGGDLYCYENRKDGFINKIWYKIEDYVKGNFNGYITLMKPEYKALLKLYKTRGKLYESFSYPSNLYKDNSLKTYDKEGLYIQVGNSATYTNNHFEIFKKLRPYKDKNIKLFCILSYGDMKYAKVVISKGKKIFGEKFIPITDFMKFDDYMKFLSKIDIAIFAHDRQQGFGNITSLLSMKKTVYIKENIATYEVLENLGLSVKSFDQFENLEKFDDNILEKNKKIIKERFSQKRLIEEWKVIFSD